MGEIQISQWRPASSAFPAPPKLSSLAAQGAPSGPWTCNHGVYLITTRL
jgi:hypothetical protein